MVRTFGSPRHDALVGYLRQRREEAGLTQVQVARRLGRYQSFVTDYERGKKRIDAIELVAICDAIGFDPCEALKVIREVRHTRPEVKYVRPEAKPSRKSARRPRKKR